MEYVSEEQQVEQIKKWWAENGSSIIIGVVLGVGGIIGWRFWGEHQINQAAQASTHFEAMLFSLKNNQLDKAEQSAQLIHNEFSGTPYSVYAQLTLAKIQFEQKQYAQAETTYQAIIDDNGSDPIGFVARKRLADVYIDEKKYDEALAVLSVDYPPSFTAAFEERKGDIYRYQGKKDEANAAYLLAKFADIKAEDTQFLQQKADSLGTY